jgi:hypothetical protein
MVTRTPLAQFILLSMLLHAMAILLFGAPSGGSREGRAMWGGLDVVIRGPLREDKVEPAKTPPIPDTPKEVKKTPVIPPLLMAPPDPVPERPPAFEVPPPSAPVSTPAPARSPAADLPAPAVPEAEPVMAPALTRELPAVELPSMPRLERADPLPEPLIAPAPLPAAEKEIAPIELKALPRLEALQPLATLPVEPLPSPIERVEAPPPTAVAAPRMEPPQVEPPRVESSRVVPPIETPAVQPSPFRAPSPSAGRAEERSTDYDPTAAAPSLDAEALRQRAGELARQGTGQRAVLAFPMPPIPTRKSKMEEAIENARKPDCRTAYQGLGLAAVVPLIANQFGEGSCRW